MFMLQILPNPWIFLQSQISVQLLSNLRFFFSAVFNPAFIMFYLVLAGKDFGRISRSSALHWFSVRASATSIPINFW